MPIHDAIGRDPVSFFVRRRGSAELARAHAGDADPAVVCLATGVAWSF